MNISNTIFDPNAMLIWLKSLPNKRHRYFWYTTNYWATHLLNSNEELDNYPCSIRYLISTGYYDIILLTTKTITVRLKTGEVISERLPYWIPTLDGFYYPHECIKFLTPHEPNMYSFRS